MLGCIDEEWLDIACLLAFTGMRWCEVAGLKWQDIDLDAGTLKIRRANVKGKVGDPKTRKSRRTVGLVDEVIDCLRARLARMEAQKHPGLQYDWVVCKEDGDLHRGYPMAKSLKRACRDAGVEIRFTQHGLRRTFNDLARRRGRAMVVMATVGHTTEGMHEHYSHVDIDEKRALAQAVANDVRRSASDNEAETSPAEPEPAEASPETEERQNRHLDRHRHSIAGGSKDQNPE